ncbi:MAG: hypothetical protein ABSG25_12060 [Bryobacteraceae bacterium]
MVDAEFWKSPEAPSAETIAMKSAFDGVADLLFSVGILTQELLEGQIPALVWDSAIAAGWWRLASETPQEMFREQLGHYWVWREEGKDWKGLFRSELRKWRAQLLDAAGTLPLSIASLGTERSASPEPLTDVGKESSSPTPVATAAIQPSWKELQNVFVQYAAEHDEVAAVWRWIYTEGTIFTAVALALNAGPDVHPSNVLGRMYRNPDVSARPPAPKGQWSLEGGLPASQDLFRVIAGRAAGRLPIPSDAEPWRLWLDRMRAEGYATEMPALGKSGQTLGPYPQGFEDRHIEHVFKASADFCLVRSLAEASGPSPSQAIEGGGGQSALQGGDGSIGPSSGERAEINVPPCPAGEKSSTPIADAPHHSLDLASEVARNSAVAAYKKHWVCSEAGLARTARVDPADLSKWKKGLLTAASDKRTRIENALKNNDQPTPAPKHSEDF